MTHFHGNLPREADERFRDQIDHFLVKVGIGTGQEKGGHRLPVGIEHGGGKGDQAGLALAVTDGIALSADLFQRLTGREGIFPQACLDYFRGLIGQQNTARCAAPRRFFPAAVSA